MLNCALITAPYEVERYNVIMHYMFQMSYNDNDKYMIIMFHDILIAYIQINVSHAILKFVSQRIMCGFARHDIKCTYYSLSL